MNEDQAILFFWLSLLFGFPGIFALLTSGLGIKWATIVIVVLVIALLVVFSWPAAVHSAETITSTRTFHS